MKLNFMFIKVLAAALLLTSCSGHSGESPVVNADSLKVEQVPYQQLFLPDTAYSSAAAVYYVIENKDSADHTLKDLTDRYAASAGSFTFRKNLMRDADFGGTVTGEPTMVEVVWRFDTWVDNRTTRFGYWAGGTGWTGQPVYVKWNDEQMEKFRTDSQSLTNEFSNEEIIFGSLCSKGYFLNFNTGKESRKSIDLHNTIKGSASLDPELYNLYIGHGVPRAMPMSSLAIDLLQHKITTIFSDNKAWRDWAASDSSPVVVGGYLFWPGENGTLYKFSRSQGALELVSALRYKVRGSAPGIESSMAVYRNYGYFSDNHGNILCVNLNTMKPVWHYYNHDDSDGTVVLREEEGVPYLYAASEVDKQGYNGLCYIVKINALNGSLIWEQKVPCKRIGLGSKSLDGGAYSTPLLGRGDCADMIFINMCRNGASKNSGELMAFSTTDGKQLYAVPYKLFAWSSPVGFYNEQNQMYIFSGDAGGNVYLIRAKDGKLLFTKQMANNFESSPVVVGNAAVVGSRTNGIYKFVIK
ncbi:MAG: PQQ-binding-like beta-propeller repeat protein [Bacteroidales bacterium]|nr:PQQ-binding-like beta-propeller repeat protein [Bacteroidales bacterium]